MLIQLEFTPTAADYADSLAIFGQNLKGRLLFWRAFWLIGLFVGGATLNSAALGPRADWYAPFVLPALPLVAAVAIIFFVPGNQRRRLETQIQASPQLRSPVVWVLDEARVIQRTPLAEGKLAWNFFQKAIVTDQFYLLIHAANKQMFSFVPKRAFTESATETAFRALVEQKLGPCETRPRHTWQRWLVNGLGLAWLSLTTLFFWYLIWGRMFGQ